MKLNINIPTRGRPEKLDECLRSIDYHGEMKIYIYCYDRKADLPDKLSQYEETLGHDYCIIEGSNCIENDIYNNNCGIVSDDGGGGGGGSDGEEAIPGYNIIILIGALCVLSVVLIKKCRK